MKFCQRGAWQWSGDPAQSVGHQQLNRPACATQQPAPVGLLLSVQLSTPWRGRSGAMPAKLGFSIASCSGEVGAAGRPCPRLSRAARPSTSCPPRCPRRTLNSPPASCCGTAPTARAGARPGAGGGGGARCLSPPQHAPASHPSSSLFPTTRPAAGSASTRRRLRWRWRRRRACTRCSCSATSSRLRRVWSCWWTRRVLPPTPASRPCSSASASSTLTPTNAPSSRPGSSSRCR